MRLCHFRNEVGVLAVRRFVRPQLLHRTTVRLGYDLVRFSSAIVDDCERLTLSPPLLWQRVLVMV